jgi:hypothetical protein
MDWHKTQWELHGEGYRDMWSSFNAEDDEKPTQIIVEPYDPFDITQCDSLVFTLTPTIVEESSSLSNKAGPKCAVSFGSIR